MSTSFYPLASLSQIESTPSREDGLPADLEEDLRAYGCKLIHEAGILLNQKQVAVAAAQIIFQRFWYVTSMKQFGVGDIGMGALYLASKLEECPLRIRDLINVYDLLLQRATHSLNKVSGKAFQYVPMSYFGNTFYHLKDALVVAEMQVLKRLGFNVQVVLPYGTLINYMRVLGLISRKDACSRAWGYLNDAWVQIPLPLTVVSLDYSLQTPVYALYQVPTIVSAAILLTVRHLNISLPSAPPNCWWELFDTSWEDLWSQVNPTSAFSAMLDHCSISHKGGLVLWSRSFTPDAAHLASSSASPVNSLIREALIEGRTTEEQYEKDGYAVKWTFVNDLELIFVVAYQRILQLTYVNDLLSALKSLFVEYFEPFLTSFVASLHTGNSARSVVGNLSSWNFAQAFEGWDAIFDKLLKGLEDKAAQDRKSRLRTAARPAVDNRTPPSDDQDTAISTESPAKRKNKTKAGRKWGDEPVTESDMASLDYSLDKDDNTKEPQASHDLQTLVDQESLGTRTREGLYEVKDWEFSRGKETDKSIAMALKSGVDKQTSSSSLGAFGSLIARLTGSKTLSEQDLMPVLEGMKQHLMKKNVAKEIAEKVCEGVGESLVGKKVGSFETTNAAVRTALSLSLTRILTPKTSTDLLLSIRTKLTSPLPSSQQRMPYSITFVGVNGVGKSTNLSKVCFWLIQNGLRVLIAACDTFRSGAVEQLRVHVRNLSMLGVNGAADSKGRVELFERGYGKDAAAIAKEAIAYGRDKDFDVVLIDTAGRMQDNEPLMRALAKLVSVNNPDKIIFVGEALVGNEAVDQLTKFDRALRDFSSASGKGRGIDGMLVTKWDTVDDKSKSRDLMINLL
ncbi:hypothetical protein C0993_003407 [Termitomyces sp. T159_Od127]|nr:hypothetical protein C0993_003407 [Termitomyces sp. T159_Od127]